MRVLFATSECTPWAKTGGLGDVSAALPHALAALGHELRVLMPAYRGALQMLGGRAGAYRRHPLPRSSRWPPAQLIELANDGFTLWLLDCPALYDRDGGPYADPQGRDYDDNALRFGLLSDVAARLAAGEAGPGWRPQVLHCNDWQTGLAPSYLNLRSTRTAISVFTIHNLAFQGMFSRETGLTLGLPDEWLTIDGVLHWERLSMLKAGLRHAECITTVSPTYAREIQRETAGFGMDGMLRHRAADLYGLLNGVDMASWNPSTDPRIAARYDAESLSGKADNKAALLQRFGLPVLPRSVLLGIVSRLTTQKGIDLVLEALPALLAHGDQLVVLGQGEARFERELRQAAAAHPQQVAVRIGFDESLAHLIEAGADAFLMPSRFEPCGLNQMYSQVYGTPPIVSPCGGLADSVIDEDGREQGSGFVLDQISAAGLLRAVQRARSLYLDSPADWRALQRRAMRRRFGWEDTARRYAILYAQYLRRRAAALVAPAVA